MIRRYIFFWLAIVLMIYLQSTYMGFIAFNGVKPDIALIILLFISIRGGGKTAVLMGFTTGLISDFISLSPLGFYGLIKTTLAYTVSFLGKVVSTDSILFQWLVIAIMTFLKYLLSFLLIVVFSINENASMFSSSVFIIELIYNLLLTPLIFSLANWLIEKTGKS